MPTADAFDAVLLAGGRARRFGGDKPGALVGGRTLVGRVAGAAAGAERLVLVGPAREGLPGAVVVREDPPGAGPVPALRTGLAEVRAPWVAVLAADLPFLLAEHVAALRAAAGRHGTGAVMVDGGGRAQWLAGCWHTGRLRAALAGYAGGSLGGLFGPLRPAPVAFAAGPRPPWYDCDTPEAYEQARRIAED